MMMLVNHTHTHDVNQKESALKESLLCDFINIPYKDREV